MKTKILLITKLFSLTNSDPQSPKNVYSLRNRKPSVYNVETRVLIEEPITELQRLLTIVQPIVQPKVQTKEQIAALRQERNKVSCPTCGIILHSSSLLRTHILNVHIKERYFFCDLCR